MVSTLAAPQNLVTDAWVKSTWEEFLAACDRPEMEKARCYYDAGWMRIETMPRSGQKASALRTFGGARILGGGECYRYCFCGGGWGESAN